MRVLFVNIENGMEADGFRKVAPIAREIDPETEVCCLATVKTCSLELLCFAGPDGLDFEDALMSKNGTRLFWN